MLVLIKEERRLFMMILVIPAKSRTTCGDRFQRLRANT